MDLWVVKYASRLSRIGDFSGDSSVRGARMRGVFASRRFGAHTQVRPYQLLMIVTACRFA